jgi:hypothetical protein
MEKKNVWKKIRNKIKHSPIFILAIFVFWFIVRVGTRPSRVLYPCQLTILHNIIVSFQVFLASSTNTFVIFWRKIISSKIFWIFITLISLFILGLILGAKGIRLF